MQILIKTFEKSFETISFTLHYIFLDPCEEKNCLVFKLLYILKFCIIIITIIIKCVL
jgi:hypothetical protein